MPHTYLTYSRDLGDFKHDLKELSSKGLYGLRLINKGKSIREFIGRIEEILDYSRDKNIALEILIDLPGEKALIGNVGKVVNIEKNATCFLCNEKEEPGQNKIPTLNFLNRIDRTMVFPGDIVSIADGELEMRIVSIDENSVTCTALNSFGLTSNRSFTVKGNKLPERPVSGHDRALLDALKSTDLAKRIKILVSFVTQASQVKDLSQDFRVVSKVENIIDGKELQEIIKVSDAVMLGRGDLTSTSRMSDVFPFQKLVIETCMALDKELILATGLFGDLKNSGKPSISDILDFGYLRSMNVDAFLIAGSNANLYPFETLDLITNFENM